MVSEVLPRSSKSLVLDNSELLTTAEQLPFAKCCKEHFTSQTYVMSILIVPIFT